MRICVRERSGSDMTLSKQDGTRGRVLIIAGSDSGGGAGIQADIKTVTALGGFASTAITAITAQNTLGVQGIWPVSDTAVLAQIQSVLSDLGADTIKTGMLGSARLVELIGDRLDGLAPETDRVVDPVMVATSGDRLVDQAAISAIAAILIPGAALVTPNAPEAEILTGKAVETVDGQRRAAERLLEQGARAALVKGGHIPGGVLTDVLQTTDGEWIFEGTRIPGRATHGTGCTLASAIATRMSFAASVSEAVEVARTYLRGAIEHAPALGAGQGPVNHAWTLRPMPDD